MAVYQYWSRGLLTDNLLEPLLNSFPDIIHSVDKDGNIVYANMRASELLGYSQDELVGLNIYKLYAPEIQSQVKKGFNRLKQEGDITIRESLLKTKSGELITVEIRSFSVYDDKGEFLRTFSILRDVREVKEMRDNLLHAERLSGIGQLAACVVHDIHNPLMVIQMYTEMLLQDATKYMAPDSCGEVSDFLKQMQRASEKIQKLLAHLRSFARRETETKEDGDVNLLIDDALFMVMNKIIKNNIRVNRHDKDRDCPIRCSIIEIEQVIMNILSNACDAMIPSTKRTLRLSLNEEETDDGKFYRISIQDTGCGIAEKDLPAVFDSFYTTKKRGQGTGLGLAICTEVIEKHRGKIEVESVLGEGTTFHIVLPQDSDDTDQPEISEETVTLGNESSG